MSQSTTTRAAEHVDVAGPPDGAPLVLVHGTVFNRSMWAPQREALSDEFRVIAPDLPGHGERRDEQFDLEAGIQTVEAVVDRYADDEPVHLLGLSLGGYVATAFAGRNPDRVERLVLSGSSANPTGVLGRLSDAVGRLTLYASKSDRVEGLVDRVAARWVRKRDLPRELEDEIVDAGFDLRPFGQAGVEIADVDFRGALSRFDGPVLVCNGRWDLIMRSGEKKHAGAVRDGRVVVIGGAGHTCTLEQVDDYDDVVRNFLSADDRVR